MSLMIYLEGKIFWEENRESCFFIKKVKHIILVLNIKQKQYQSYPAEYKLNLIVKAYEWLQLPSCSCATTLTYLPHIGTLRSISSKTYPRACTQRNDHFTQLIATAIPVPDHSSSHLTIQSLRQIIDQQEYRYQHSLL